MAILPVIMSGGSGTRLWPASTDDRPKQFHALASSNTMLHETVARLTARGFLPPLLVCSERHASIVRDQMAQLGVTPSGVILEPVGRNTAAVGVFAALWAARHAPGAEVLLLPADHVVENAEAFRQAVAGSTVLARDHIVTFGIQPTAPETGFGYIEAGDALTQASFRIRRFVEKPNIETAQRYLAEGGYYWNAGIFLFRPERLLAEAQRFCPEVLEQSRLALERGTESEGGLLLAEAPFRACPSLPIDIAIMEKTNIGAVTPCDVGWADIGSWSELWRHGPLDGDCNNSRGDTLALESSGSLLWSNGPSISVVGISDLIVIATADHVLVLPRERSQDVKRIVEQRRKPR